MLCVALALLLGLYRGADAAAECVKKIQPVDIIFIFDGSPRVTAADFQKSKTFMEKIIEGRAIGPDDTQIGFLVFDYYSNLFHLSSYHKKQNILRRIKSTPFSGTEGNLLNVLKFAGTASFIRDHGLRTYVAQIAILITDRRGSSLKDTIHAANLMLDKGVSVFSIGVGDGVDKAELKAIASDPDSQHMFLLDNFNALDGIRETLETRVCEVKPAFLCNSVADIVFLLDSSKNVGERNLKLAVEFVLNVTSEFFLGSGNVRVGVDTFSTVFNQELTLKENNSRLGLKTALSSLTYTGGDLVNTGNAIKMMREKSFTPSSFYYRTHFSKFAVVLTNGQSSDKSLTSHEAQEARDAGIKLLAIGVGPFVDETELSAITTGEGNQNVYQSSTFEALHTLKDLITSKLCEEFVEDRHYPPLPEPGTYADIIFLVSSSSRIGKYNFKLLRSFVKSFVKELDIGQDTVRVGIEKFNSRPYGEIHLNQFNNTADLLDAISQIEFKHGGSDTAAAITYMDENMFKATNGDHPEVPNIAIILTDGNSDNPEETKAAADRARANGINIFVVGVGNMTSKEELKDMASDPKKSHIFVVTDFAKLNSITTDVRAKTYRDFLPICKDDIHDCYMMCDLMFDTYDCDRFCESCSPIRRTSATSNKCFYKGSHYDQGDKWDDGCAYECECADSNTGQYVCYNKCPSYFNLPKECKLVPRSGECCLEPTCEFRETYHVKKVYKPCEHDGVKYLQGQVWSQGCEFECICLDVSTGFYACQSKCSQYDSLPSNCKLVRPPGECCEKPDCEFQTQVGKFTGIGRPHTSAISTGVAEMNWTCVDKSAKCSMYPPDLCISQANRTFALDNCRKFCKLCDQEDMSTYYDVCIYEGRSFKQGQRWYDGCQKACVCEEAASGYVRCEDRCPNYLNVPFGCQLVNVSGQCCLSLQCDIQGTFVSSQTIKGTVGAVPVAKHATKGREELSQAPRPTYAPGGPAEEGQPASLTCTANTDECPNLFVLKWLAGSREVAICTSKLCGSPYRSSGDFNPSITSVGSTMVITNVSRSSPFNMETHWRCDSCGSLNGLEYNKLEIYAQPRSPRCSVREDLVGGDIMSVTLSCSTNKVYPTAKCSFYRIKSNGSRFSIVSAPIYEHHETGDAPVYYRSTCSVSVPVTELGEGTHSFQAYIYPNVTGGEHLVRAITPDTIVNLTAAQASHTCSPAMVHGFFSGNSSRCNCSLTYGGYPRGAAQWYNGDEPVAVNTDDLIDVTLSQDLHKIYTCEAVSALGRSLGSILRVNFLDSFIDPASTPSPGQTWSTLSPGAVVAIVAAVVITCVATGLTVVFWETSL